MKIGTIGTGSIVDLFIRSCQRVANVDCKFVYSRSLSKAEDFAKSHDIDYFTDSLETLLTSSEIDAVYVASPNSLHYSHAMNALKHGKHVILEKPTVATVEEYNKLIHVAKSNNVYIVEAIVNTHCATMKFLQNSLTLLGNIKCITANFSQYSSKYDKYRKHEITNVFDLNMEGGALVDIGIYNLYICVHLFGTPNSYKYYPNVGFNGVDTSGVLVLKYPSFVATLLGAKDCYGPSYFTIQGEDGTILIDEGSAGVCHHASLMKKEKIADEFRQDDCHMMYEISDFETAFRKRDEKSIENWNNETLKVLDILEKSRVDAGIIFNHNHDS